MENLDNLVTESVNENSKNIDALSTIEMVKIINSEDVKVAEAVGKESENIAKAIDEISKRYVKGGRLIYIGAGSSGRMGTLDAVELTPTYNVSPERAFGLIAGGKEAMYRAVEGAEDSRELGREDLVNCKLSNLDCVVGIAASGRTPYVLGGLDYAKEVGALTVMISSNRNENVEKSADIVITPIVGAEVISGSTRMKSGTAAKMVVNSISTGVMIKSGMVYGNYMVNVLPTNKKLETRAVRMISSITGLDIEKSSKLFEESGKSVAVSIIMNKASIDKDKAQKLLKESNNMVRIAIEKAKSA
ncbi:N-acetylmuramic acid 6-phosphate etherase [Brachyspira hyodysenteriae]|uniref:N-acetylmuramic acid 6-phosphate etherase n=1 Tax=Brachyspira hyodysenteriae TaxID=159 RepID=UPI0022CDB80E|nr:N-acetylmuramic acid 6-phosphate etherase [Brachyspira hyodysenteriae]MCZ9961721.1 N-acetylmuramic acid 6-phosphate etherase [Brachyspira hyodysenteriae]